MVLTCSNMFEHIGQILPQLAGEAKIVVSAGPWSLGGTWSFCIQNPSRPYTTRLCSGHACDMLWHLEFQWVSVMHSLIFRAWQPKNQCRAEVFHGLWDLPKTAWKGALFHVYLMTLPSFHRGPSQCGQQVFLQWRHRNRPGISDSVLRILLSQLALLVISGPFTSSASSPYAKAAKSAQRKPNLPLQDWVDNL